MNLDIDSIRLDGGTQPREAIDYAVVDDYQDDMEAGAKFPLIDVFYDGSAYWLADGFHRVRAAMACEWSSIAANVHQGSIDDARWFSFGVNKSHGFRRTNRDKQRAVMSALQHPKSKGLTGSEIAKHVGVSHTMVNSILQTLQDTPTTRTATRKGKTYEMDTTNIGRHPQIEEEIVVNPGPSVDAGGGAYDVSAPPTEQPGVTGATNSEFWNNVQAGAFLESVRTIADCPLTSAEILEHLKERGTERDLDAIARSYEFLGSIVTRIH